MVWTWTDAEGNTETGTTYDTATLCGTGCYVFEAGSVTDDSGFTWEINSVISGELEAAGGDGDTATVCSPGFDPTPLPTADPCLSNCFSHSCDYWSERGYQCVNMESDYGCDCTNCDCPTSAPMPVPTAMPTLDAICLTFHM